jgi:hypothetical protein
MATIAERVARGAALLDEREPGWWQRIDLGALDMDEPCECVLGQLATDKQVDWRRAWPLICNQFDVRASFWVADDERPSDVDLGFTGPPNLGEFWRELIEKRRAA